MTNPLVSIIVRTKDRPLLLADAIESIKAQTYRPIEVCVVNDGGCKLDLEVIKTGLGDIGFHYLRHHKSLGRATALNKGIGHSKGTYVGILDDDDIYYPSAIKTLLDASIKNRNRPVYGQVLCRKKWIKDRGRERDLDFIMGAPFCMGRLLFENYIPTNALLVPRIWIEKTGPFDTQFEIFEDWDWAIRLAEVCKPMFIASQVGEYRIFSDATIIGKGGEEMHRTFKEKILQKHMNKAKAGDFLDYIQAIVDRVVLQKDAVAYELKERLDELNRQVEIKTEWVRERDERIRSLGETIHGLEQTVHEMEEGLRRRDREIRRIVTSFPYKMVMLIHSSVERMRRGLGRGNDD